MTNIIKTTLLLAFIVMLVGGLYYFLRERGVFDGGMQTAEQVRMETDKLETEIIAELRRVNSITIDTGVFSLPEYRGLVDPIVPPDPSPPISRPNPFDRY